MRRTELDSRRKELLEKEDSFEFYFTLLRYLPHVLVMFSPLAKKLPTCIDREQNFFSIHHREPFSHSDLLMSLQRGVYCPGETIKLNLQYKYVEARKMGLVKCRLNKYKRLNKKENKNIYKKTVKEQNGRFEHH